MKKNLLPTLSGAALALGLLAPISASALVINFIELPNDGGIQVTTDGGVDVTKANAETFFISSPAVPGGYAPDLIQNRIGISRTSSGYLFAILESPGGPVSDYIWVHQFIPQFTVIDFISDTGSPLVLPMTPTATIVENGGLQFVGSYLNDRGEEVQFNVQSDVDSVPDGGSTLALLGLALTGVAALRTKFGN